ERAPGAAAAAASWRDHPLADSRFLFFIFVLLGVRTLFAHQWLTMPDYVIRCYPEEVGARFEWINGLNPLIIVIGTPLVAGLTRRVHVLTMMIIGTSVSALATFLLVPGPNLAALLAYVVIFSIGEALWSSRFLEYVADIAPPERVGVYMGVANLPWFLAKFTTGLYSGTMLAAFVPKDGPQDSSTLWLVYACVALTSPVGLVLARRWLLAGVKA
ncbi:MAG TPA: MFS transporter, partial [Myxococcota bacterium]|nr:MFS transporter [Myxococcota bacterium]